MAVLFMRPLENDPTLALVGVGIDADIANHMLRHRNTLRPWSRQGPAPFRSRGVIRPTDHPDRASHHIIASAPGTVPVVLPSHLRRTNAQSVQRLQVLSFRFRDLLDRALLVL